MAIPKEPRQLMINIMYLVLTALLALNVSAEIFNAFDVVNNGLKSSNNALDQANSKLPDVIKDRAKKKAELETYAERVDPAREYSQEFSEYVDEMVNYMIDETGNQNGEVDDGDYIVFKGVRELDGKKNKDITTRYLVEDGKGDELKAKIQEFHDKFLALIDEEDRAAFESEIALSVDDETWRKAMQKDRSKKSWAAFNFQQMPLAATLPMFSKYKNDAKSTEAAVLNYLMGKVGGEDIVLDQFKVVSAPKKSYVIAGEPFETEVFLSAAASKATNTNVELAVNGQSLEVDETGAATWRTTASGVGVKEYRATATVTNPVTGEKNEYTSTFEYEVGQRSANVAAEKMNVFYMGVDNPISVTAAGVPTKDLRVSGTGAGITLERKDANHYNVRVSQQGESTITVSGGGLSPTNFVFRTKRIPDPVAMVGKESSGSMGNGEFKAQQGVRAVLQNFDFDARCDIVGYRLVRAPKRQDVQIAVNSGAVYGSEARELVNRATPGDRFFFEDVKAKCPGDRASRTINSMVFNIR